jgi:hypothetical protein
MVKTAGKQRQERQGCGSGEELRFGPSEGTQSVKILACWDGLFSTKAMEFQVFFSWLCW